MSAALKHTWGTRPSAWCLSGACQSPSAAAAPESASGRLGAEGVAHVKICLEVKPDTLLLRGLWRAGQAPIMVHRGFYEGAKAHAADIVRLVGEATAAYGRTVPVWVTGHSLGGGYANCLILHLLAQRQGAQLFGAGAAAAAAAGGCACGGCVCLRVWAS